VSIVPIYSAAVGLHTLFRRYCSDRIEFWRAEYDRLAPDARRSDGSYSDEACDIFPRYTVLADIRDEATRLNADVLTDFEDVRERLIIAAQYAVGLFAPSKDARQEQAVAEERALAVAFIRMQLPAECLSAEPLPYSYRLTPPESAALRSRIRSRWGLNMEKFCWFPLNAEKPEFAEAFRWSCLEDHLTESWLYEALELRGVDRYWLMHEFGWDRVESRLLVSPGYIDGAERILSSGELDWIAYFSHEDSATFGGWVLDLIKDFVPDWAEHLYEWRF